MHLDDPFYTAWDNTQWSSAGILDWSPFRIPTEFGESSFHVIGGTHLTQIMERTQAGVAGYAVVMPEWNSHPPFMAAITLRDGLIEAETNPHGVRYVWNSLNKRAYFPQFDLQIDRVGAESLSNFELGDTQYFAFTQNNACTISDYSGREVAVPEFSHAPLNAESRIWHLVQLENSPHTVACTPTGEPVIDWRIPVKVRFFRGNISHDSQSPLEYRWFVRASSCRATGITVSNTHFLLSSDSANTPQMIDFANLWTPIRLYPADLCESSEWVATLRSYSLAGVLLIAQCSWPATGIYMRTLGGFNVGPFSVVGGEPQIKYIQYGDFVGWKTVNGYEFARIVDGELEYVTSFEQQALDGVVRVGSNKYDYPSK